MKFNLFSLGLLAFTLLFSCSNNDESDTDGNNPESSKPNILLIIADDMGLDATPGYNNIGNTKPNMPTLQSMINSGLQFNNLWSNPVCTPTRGTILTGKYGFRTNVLKVDDPMPTVETSLQRHLDNTNSGYSHAVIGKWHLSSDPSHPTIMGVDYYAGLINGGVQSYTNWNLTENGTTSGSNEYTTTKFTNLAIDWVDQQTQPWFLWLAYNAPHTPFHLPPNDLHGQGNLPSDQTSIDANPLPYYLAMIEAMDTEMGRLIASLSEAERNNTLIIFIGDNGTPNQVVQEYASQRAKGSIYQGGVNVPMIVSGKGVTRINAIEDALINTTDLFATISELAGNSMPEINDSKSFKDLLASSNAETRDYTYTEIGNNAGGSDYTIRNTTHKYMLFEDGTERFYNLSNNPLENPNLLNINQLPLSAVNSAIKDELIAELNSIRN
jgi:arylsulfatase A-like enzyme